MLTVFGSKIYFFCKHFYIILYIAICRGFVQLSSTRCINYETFLNKNIDIITVFENVLNDYKMRMLMSGTSRIHYLALEHIYTGILYILLKQDVLTFIARLKNVIFNYFQISILNCVAGCHQKRLIAKLIDWDLVKLIHIFKRHNHGCVYLYLEIENDLFIKKRGTTMNRKRRFHHLMGVIVFVAILIGARSLSQQILPENESCNLV